MLFYKPRNGEKGLAEAEREPKHQLRALSDASEAEAQIFSEPDQELLKIIFMPALVDISL